MLFPYQYQCPNSDATNFFEAPETTYLNLINFVPAIKGQLDTWKQKIQSLYNTNAGEISKFFGIGTFNSAATFATAERSGTTQIPHKAFWENDFLTQTADYTDAPIDVSASEFFRINPNAMDPRITTAFVGLDKFNYKDLNNKNLRNFNAINWMIYKQVPQLPEEVEQTIPIQFSETPFFRFALNLLTGGIPFGFRLDSGLILPNGLPFQALIPESSCAIGEEAWATKGNISLDTFNNTGLEVPSAMYGVQNKTTGFCYNLTDRVSLKPTTIATGNWQDNPAETISTRDLGQLKYNGGNPPVQAYLVNPSFNLLEPNQLDPQDLKVGYVGIGQASLAIFKGNYRVSAYSKPFDVFGVANDNDCVYQETNKSFSSLSGNPWKLAKAILVVLEP